MWPKVSSRPPASTPSPGIIGVHHCATIYIYESFCAASFFFLIYLVCVWQGIYVEVGGQLVHVISLSLSCVPRGSDQATRWWPVALPAEPSFWPSAVGFINSFSTTIWHKNPQKIVN